MLELHDLAQINDGGAAHVAGMAESIQGFRNLVESRREQDTVKVQRVGVSCNGSGHRAPGKCG